MFTRQQIAALLGESWAAVLHTEFDKPYMQNLVKILRDERQKYNIFPEQDNVFRAYLETPYDKVKVVLLGQDPYHTKGMAQGLAFSVPEGTYPLPPSLKNILEELASDIEDGFLNQSPDLTRWAKQGVLLLNTVLTVREGQAMSHRGIGWEEFTRRTVEAVAHSFGHPVFILLGREAQSYVQYLDPIEHWILQAPHPSPLSAHRGFFGSRIFSRTNAALKANFQTPINW